MANDEQPAPADQQAPDSDAAHACWTNCSPPPSPAGQPYHPARRHRGDRRIVEAPHHGWEPLDPIQTSNLSWPAARLN